MATSAVQLPAGHSTTFEPLTLDPKGPAKHHVKTQLHYFKDNEDGSPPEPAYVGQVESFTRPVLTVDAVVHDVSGEVDKYTLDSHGFQIYSHTSKEKAFVDDEVIKKEYYAETEQLLKDATGASRIFIFDHTIRRPPADGSAAGLRGPVQRVHIDQSYTAARSRVPHHLPDEADELLKKRHQIINVWRPIKTILKDPLAVADAHSVPETDLVPIGLIYPDRRGETLSVRPNDAHKWYFKYGQTPEEVVLIKCYDSKLDGRARRVPHTAFENPEHKDGEARESIEVRTLVFYDDQDAE